MNDKNIKLKSEIWQHFKSMQPVFVATSEGNQPRVRPLTLVYFDDKFWIATSTSSAKIKQIKENNKIEFCLMLKEGNYSGYIRGDGEANITHDKETKRTLADNIAFFKSYWKTADDPDYALLNIVIKEIAYLKPGEEYGIEILTL